MTGEPPNIRLSRLRRGDPPELGAVRLEGRLAKSDTGIVYAGRLDGARVAVVVLTAGAERDSFGRARFLAAVRARLDSGDELVGHASESDLAPWAAVRAATWDDTVAVASTLLAPVTLADRAAVGVPAGPGFVPHWFGDSNAGRWRLWPLPWPGSLTAAARWTYPASFALILAISAIALFIAVKLFEHQPPAPVPVPYPKPSPSPTTTPSSPTTPPGPRPGPSHSPGPTGGGTTAPPFV